MSFVKACVLILLLLGSWFLLRESSAQVAPGPGVAATEARR